MSFYTLLLWKVAWEFSIHSTQHHHVILPEICTLLWANSDLFLAFFRQRGLQISSVISILKNVSKKVVLPEVSRQNKPR